MNPKTLFVCRRAKSVLNLAEQASAETCSRAEPLARPTEKLPRGLDLSAGDHFPALRGFGALSFRRSAASSPRSINRRIASGEGSACRAAPGRCTSVCSRMFAEVRKGVVITLWSLTDAAYEKDANPFHAVRRGPIADSVCTARATRRYVRRCALQYTKRPRASRAASLR